jgi:hypothetical protein
MSDGVKNTNIGINVDVNGKNVVVAFDQKVQWIELKPEQAIELAYAIYEKSLKAQGKTSSVILIPRLDG